MLFLIINVFTSHFDFPSQNAVLKAGFTVNPENQNDIKTIHSVQERDTEDKKKNDWCLEIPCINLSANIGEGTTKEIMDKFIGHFEESKNG